MKWLSPEADQRLRDLWPGIMSVKAIAHALGTTESAVMARRVVLELPPRFENRATRISRSPEEIKALKARCRELAAQGKARREIAEALRISASSVCKWVGQTEYGYEDQKFDPASMRYADYEARWKARAEKVGGVRFQDMRCNDAIGKAPLIETHLSRAA